MRPEKPIVNHSLEMVICFLYFLFAVVLAEHGVVLEECKESYCGNGPAVRFPFRIKGKQPGHCGYPGFDLYCTDSNETLLELPTSVKLLLTIIDYRSQVIYASDQQGCLPRQFSHFNLSASPFQFQEESFSDYYTLFNCRSSTGRYRGQQIPCLSPLDCEVYAFPSYNDIARISLLSCTKMYNIPYSIPDNVFSQDNIILSWSNPECGHCADKSKYCRLKDNSTEHECYGKIITHNKGALTKKVTPAVILGFFFMVPVIIAVYRIYKSDKVEKEYQVRVEKFLHDYKALNPTRFSYADIKRIANQFKDELGQGAYGTVFKGKLSNEILVAVKVLNNSKGNGEEFVNEVGTMARIHHVNVVRLIGFCADGFRRALVYEYLPNDSLQKFISSPDKKNHFLGWKRLQDIALGVAKGIEYLHQGCDRRILHFDIKPHNVLLDQNFNPKISDFGLAKLCSKDQSAVSMTTARGTIGYIAPEVFSRNFGSVSHKSDVYSFGMLVLEMVGGRKNVDVVDGNDEQIYFPEWIYNLLEEGEEDLRFHIEEEGDAKVAKKLAVVGLRCIQWNPMDRPCMKIVVQMLEGDGDNLTKPPNPFSSAGPKKMTTSRIPGRRVHPELEVISEEE